MEAKIKTQPTLLIVDDEGGIREVLTLALEAGGYRCVSASNGEEALSIFEAGMDEFDGVITDLNMPGMDGMSLIRQLHWLRPELHIVVSSGCITDECRQVLEALGVNATLPKPYTAAQLLRCVEPIRQAAGSRTEVKKETAIRGKATTGAGQLGKGKAGVPWHPVAAGV